MVVLILVLVVPACMLFGAAAGCLASRHTLRRSNSSFRCALRVESGVVGGIRRHRRRWFYGCWVHDVLLLQRGRLIISQQHLPVRCAEAVRVDKDGMVTVPFRLDDGAVVSVSCKEPDLAKMVGPFLMAELEHLERADS